MEAGESMTDTMKQYTPEQLEAMQQPVRKQDHPFVKALLNTQGTFLHHHFKKGVACIWFVSHQFELKTIETLQQHYHQLILVFLSKKGLSQFMHSPLRHEQHTFYYFNDCDFNTSFAFAIQQIEYSHVVITLEYETPVTTFSIEVEDLMPDVLYRIGMENMYPTYIINRLNLHYRLNHYMKYYINEMCYQTSGLSEVQLAVKQDQTSKQRIQQLQDVYDALEMIEAIYTETGIPDVSTHQEANDLIIQISTYLETQPDEVIIQVKSDIREKMSTFHYHLLNAGRAETLVIAYCFPPYIDTSGNVMAKRVRDKGEIVDIISNNMSRIRQKDMKLNTLSEHLVDTHYLLDAKQAFSSWESISGFTEQGLEVLAAHPKTYRHLYTRAMFPQSHFLGFEIKVQQPDIHWRAEFSDPLHTTVTSDLRYAPIQDEVYITRIRQLIHPELVHLVDDNVFNVCELLALSHADELIFTNEHQLQYMIERFDRHIQQSIQQRAVISRHPIPIPGDYKKVISNYQIDPNVVNLGYFGNFYATRGFNEIELVCKYIESTGETDFKIHCFTNIRGNVKTMYRNSDFKDYIVLHPLVGYFEFLNITQLLDGLLLFDAHTIGIKTINPYVPSKLSDYKGSGKHVWAFTEYGSVMSQDVDIINTPMTDFEHYIDGFRQIKDAVKRLKTD